MVRTPAVSHGTLAPGRRLARIGGLAGLVALTATGCSGEEVLRFGWPEAVTPQGERMQVFWTWSVIAALVVGVIVWALILWPVIAHRKKGDTLPKQFQYNHFLEFFYTAIPALAVVVLFYFTVVTQNYVLAKADADDVDVTVDVVAFQWNWEFTYQDTRTPDGEPVRTLGTSDLIPILVLPTDQTIHYNLRARDVIHSFFVPEFNFKRDVFPAPEKNNQDSSFQNSIDREGSFVGRCAELCGIYHSAMNFEVRALSPERFDRYMSLRQQENPRTEDPYTAGEALAEMQRTDPSCGELCSPLATTTVPFDTKRNSSR
ncbi:MAG TPA: cytochrome c oxidase subunit II [Actinophytocola sp.]|uniref:aa3-type cytochrome oxidase subunit II n=1 Tax=Actinophytocola sp. TaxID=1872138 RepID=UPI002DB8DA44|nr:cytochrome c oxidase subunit II [Actinophytocola sp.]HEU5473963.1 cytochrome c oxidase subunit II [Actinophytocola sp.]